MLLHLQGGTAMENGKALSYPLQGLTERDYSGILWMKEKFIH